MAVATKTQVGIIGAGPSGLLLSHLLHLQGIASVVVERRSRSYVLERVRAGVLEQATAEVLRRAGVGTRMDSDGLMHECVEICAAGERYKIDFRPHGASMTVYGQTELTRDLADARDALGGELLYGAEDVTIERLSGRTAELTLLYAGLPCRIECDFIAGCDGFHGVSRQAIPTSVLKAHERVYPFGWLGVLADTPPVSDELVYSSDERGFALCSMRSKTRTRCYVQCAPDEDLAEWGDARFWDELRARLPEDLARRVQIAPSIEKLVAPLRSFVAEPMQYERLFLAGDAAHIVPPTGAKGLNLAIRDVHCLAEALTAFYRNGDEGSLKSYSPQRLRNVWRAERFSAWLTGVLHRFPKQTSFDRRMQLAELDHLATSTGAQAAFVENYAGVRL